jgi:hypothetical protein
MRPVSSEKRCFDAPDGSWIRDQIGWEVSETSATRFSVRFIAFRKTGG